MIYFYLQKLTILFFYKKNFIKLYFIGILTISF